jgi:hypothetical protein
MDCLVLAGTLLAFPISALEHIRNNEARIVAHTDGASDSNVLAASGREQTEYLSGPGSQGSSSPSRSLCVIPGLARDVISVFHGKHTAFYSSQRPRQHTIHTVP